GASRATRRRRPTKARSAACSTPISRAAACRTFLPASSGAPTWFRNGFPRIRQALRGKRRCWTRTPPLSGHSGRSRTRTGKRSRTRAAAAAPPTPVKKTGLEPANEACPRNPSRCSPPATRLRNRSFRLRARWIRSAAAGSALGHGARQWPSTDRGQRFRTVFERVEGFGDAHAEPLHVARKICAGRCVRWRASSGTGSPVERLRDPAYRAHHLVDRRDLLRARYARRRDDNDDAGLRGERVNFDAPRSQRGLLRAGDGGLDVAGAVPLRALQDLRATPASSHATAAQRRSITQKPTRGNS